MAFFNLSAMPHSRQSMLDVNQTESSSAGVKRKDCTVYSRVGFRGMGVVSFLASQGLLIPSEPNQSLLFAQSLVILRLSQSEFWLVDIENTHHERIETLELAAQGLKDVYRLFCQHSHACFLLKGEQTATLFSKVCAVDLSPDAFPIGRIAQTSVARINAIVTRQEGKGEDYFLLLADLASSQYLWEALADAASEFA